MRTMMTGGRKGGGKRGEGAEPESISQDTEMLYVLESSKAKIDKMPQQCGTCGMRISEAERHVHA